MSPVSNSPAQSLPFPVALKSLGSKGCARQCKLLHRVGSQDIEPTRWKADSRFRFRNLDDNAVKVIRRLSRHGYAAYLVGGCVRDLYLEMDPKDWDIATEATPRQVKKLFRNSRIIGRRFRLVHVTFGREALDVATFRATAEPDGNDDPMIRQDNVFGTASTDARRRDFTINGLFYDVESQEILDYVGGLRDLDRKVIETIGNPWSRFREDPVRMLRAIKFAGRLGFRLADDVFQAIIDCGPDIHKAAPPRILEEISRLLERGGAQRSTRLLFKAGLFHLLMPEIAERLDAELAAGRTPPMWECMGLLDDEIKHGLDVSPHAMQALLFLVLVDEEIYRPSTEDARLDMPMLLESRLRAAAQRLRMSRRDVYMLKHIFMSQRRFTGVARGRRRRGGTQSFMSREFFMPAWTVFRSQSVVTGRYQAQRHAWRERLEE